MRLRSIGFLFAAACASIFFVSTDSKDMSSSGYFRKKQRGQERPAAVERKQERGLKNLLTILRSIFEPRRPEGCFDMSAGPEERRAMIDWLWAGDYSECTSELLDLNPEMAEYIDETTANTTTPPLEAVAREAFFRRRKTRQNFAAGLLARLRSKDLVPKHQLLLSIEAHAKGLNTLLWDMLASVRVLLCRTWVNKLVSDAMEFYPGPSYECIDWSSAVVFDNYTAQFNYDARHTADTQGERLDMTNWASIFLPRSTLPNVDLGNLQGDTPLKQTFKANFDKFSVAALCSPLHSDIVSYRRARWTESFAGIRAGTYFNRPDYHPPLAHSCFWQKPMPGVMQSSNADVEYEINFMRDDDMHKNCKYIFCGGDGLAIARVNAALARQWGKYLNEYPVVIPVQGEHPHGTAHVCHMGWRPYYPLLGGLLHACGHSECKADWTVASFNDYDHAMCILIEGIAKYFIHLDASGGGPDLDDMDAVLEFCKQSIDLAWLSYFLSDFGYLYWYFRQSIRSNDSETIDLTWRECISFMHTSESNKTQYAPMAIMRVYWSQALAPPLAAVYHKNRTLSMLGLDGSNIGWDMWMEKGNYAISTNVVRPSPDHIASFMHELNFTGHCSRALEKQMLHQRKRSPAKRVKVDKDVQSLVDHLIEKLGGSWDEACVPRDHTDSALISPPRSPKPWESIERSLADGEYDKWVRSHLGNKVTWM